MKSMRALTGACLVALLGCGPEQDPAGPSLNAAAGAKGGGITVSSANPSYGHQGDQQKQVRILGSGFLPGDQASWQRNGVADPKVQVISTVFVSTTELIATVNISSDATLAFYDIAILSSGRKGGIGTMLFEVTQAEMIPGIVDASGVTESGAVAGGGTSGAFYWSLAGGLEQLASTGYGNDLSDDALTVGGYVDGASAVKQPVVWNRAGSSWTQVALPKDPTSTGGNVWAVASDPATGGAVAVGGLEFYQSRRTQTRQPRLWLRSGSSWQRTPLPEPAGLSDSYVRGLSSALVAVGNSGARATVWEPDGSGGWTAQLVGPGNSDLRDINPGATIAVGHVSGVASYWTRTGGVWSGPITLPGNCKVAVDADDLGRILVDACQSPSGGAVITAPYTSADMIYLGGFGNKSGGVSPSAISRLGTWVSGSATVPGASVGAYWRIF